MKKSYTTFLKSFFLGMLICLSFNIQAQLHVDADEDVGIGTTNTSSAKLRVYNNTNNIYSIYSQNRGTATGTKYGIWNETRQPSNNTASSQTRGFYNVLYPYGTGPTYGFMNYIYQQGTGQKIGYYGYTMQNASSAARTYGYYSNVYPKGTGYGYGLYSSLNAHGTGIKYGFYNFVSQPTNNTSTRPTYGSWYDIRPYGTGTGYAIYNNVYQYGTGQKYGVYNYVRQSNNGTGAIYGTRNNVAPYGTGASYASYNSVSSGGSGIRYGVLSSVNKAADASSTTASYGVNVGVYDQGSSGAVYGASINSYSQGSGHIRGIYNYVQNTGSGPKYGIDNIVNATTGSTQTIRGISNTAYLYGNSSSQGLHNGAYTNDNSTGTMSAISNVLYQYGTGGTGARYALYSAVGGNTTGTYAGYFVGNVYATGTVTWGGSDERLKENVEDMNGGLDIIKQLQPKTYTFKESLHLTLPDGKQYGLMAQDLEKVLPGLVSEVEHPGSPVMRKRKVKHRIPNNKEVDVKPIEIKEDVAREGDDSVVLNDQEAPTPPDLGEGTIEIEVEEDVLEYTDPSKYKTVRYEALIPVLISAMKEQQKQIEVLQAEVAELKKERKK